MPAETEDTEDCDVLTMSDLGRGASYAFPVSEYEVAYLAGLHSHAWHRDDGELMVGHPKTPTTFAAAKALFLATRRKAER